MKKSVVILIAVIYVMAVVLVSFFGIQAEFDETICVKGIEIINKDTTYATDGVTKTVDIFFNGKETAEYQIQWRVTPTNASNNKVFFNYDKTRTFVTVDENGLVTFTRQGVITITLTPQDGTLLENAPSITIRAKRN